MTLVQILIKIIIKALINPALITQQYRIWLTNTTQTGFSRGERLFADEIEQGQLQHSYMPIDSNEVIQSFLAYVRPTIALFVETELWANTLYQLSKNDIPAVLVNARLSEQSFIQYQKFAKVSQSMMDNLALIIAQDGESAKRFRMLGAESSKISVAGSLKWTVNMSNISNPLQDDSKSLANKNQTIDNQETDNQINQKQKKQQQDEQQNDQQTEQKKQANQHKIKVDTAIIDPQKIKEAIKNRPVWVMASIMNQMCSLHCSLLSHVTQNALMKLSNRL